MIISKKCNAVLFSLLGVLLINACDSSDNSPNKSRNKASHLVETSISTLRSVNHQQILSGTLEAATSVRLHNEEAGLIRTMPYHEGDIVKQGTLLVSLDNGMIKAELAKTKALYQQAKIDYQRLKKLVFRKLASEEEVAHSLTSLNIAKAERQIQQLRMDQTQIKAPFDGIINQRNNEPGDAVKAHSYILGITKPEQLLVKISLADRWLTLLKKGDVMQLSLNGLGDQKHKAYVERIHPEVSASTRKGIIELMLRPTPKAARAGQMANVYFQSQTIERLVIPAQSIHHDIQGAYVYLLAQQENSGGSQTIAQQRYIKKGRQFGDWVEVISGVVIGEPLISKGFLGLRDGKAVTVVNKNVNAEIASDKKTEQSQRNSAAP